MGTVAKAMPQPVIPKIAPREDLNPFRIAQMQFDMAAEFLKIDRGIAANSAHAEASDGSLHPHQAG